MTLDSYAQYLVLLRDWSLFILWEGGSEVSGRVTIKLTRSPQELCSKYSSDFPLPPPPPPDWWSISYSSPLFSSSDDQSPSGPPENHVTPSKKIIQSPQIVLISVFSFAGSYHFESWPIHNWIRTNIKLAYNIQATRYLMGSFSPSLRHTCSAPMYKYGI